MTDSPPCASTYCLSGVPFFHFAKGFPRRRSLFLSLELPTPKGPPPSLARYPRPPPGQEKVQFRPTQADPTNRCKTDAPIPKKDICHSFKPQICVVDSKCPQIKQHSMAPSPAGRRIPCQKKAASRYCVLPSLSRPFSLSYTEFSQGRPQLRRGGPFLIISSSSPFSTPLPRHKKASETLLSPCILSSSLLFLPPPPQSGLTQSAPAYATGNTHKRRGRRRKTERRIE